MEWIVWMRNGGTENHFDLDYVNNKNKISTNKKQTKSRLTFVDSFHF